jgi:queuine tRNA-ribosyltransferase
MQHYTIENTSGNARHGKLKTNHGIVETPFFMPVATKGSVKLLSMEEVEKAGTECLISNAFILSLKPGLEVIGKHGGLHEFMKWNKPCFTDSGGFQVLSDGFRLKLSEEGVLFRNPFDGKKMMFTPEKAIEIQNKLGSDVAMCLDDVPKAGDNAKRVEEAVERTALWAARCKASHKNKKQMLFGISQGGTNLKLRRKSSTTISELDFDGVAIGGLGIGEGKKEMHAAINASLEVIPENKPRYLMGVGSIEEMIEAIAMGIDCFDSAFPTRTGRHGRAFSSKGNVSIEAAKHRFDLSPLDEKCRCFVCENHTRAYVHHLVKTKEENGMKYLSYHNLHFVHQLMAVIREKIAENDFKKEKILKEL